MRSRCVILVLCAVFLCGCIESDQELVPLESAELVPGMTGKWLFMEDPEQTPVCMEEYQDNQYLLKDCSNAESTPMVMRFRPLADDAWLLRMEELGGRPDEVMYTMVSLQGDTILAYGMKDNQDQVEAILRGNAVDSGWYFYEYSMELKAPEVAQRVALLRLVAENRDKLTPMRYQRQ